MFITEFVNVFTEKINVALGIAIAILSYILGDHWVLFVGFLALNVIDYITGYIKAKVTGKINSKKGADGALKKLGYWVMVMVSFLVVVIFEEIGMVIGIDLSFTIMIGWFVLASLIINECRSIVENLYEVYGDKVPKILTNGLEIASKAIEKVADLDDDQNESESQK